MLSVGVVQLDELEERGMEQSHHAEDSLDRQAVDEALALGLEELDRRINNLLHQHDYLRPARPSDQ